MIRTGVTAFMVLAGCVSGALGQNYQSLVHHPDGFVGFIVSFRGKVVRSVLDGSDYTLQVNVTQVDSATWNDPVSIDYRVRSEQERILVGQIVDFRGKVAGTLGTMPHVIACDVRPCCGHPSCPPGWNFERRRLQVSLEDRLLNLDGAEP